jgi:transcriptional regulator with XRE-family HTH domain
LRQEINEKLKEMNADLHRRRALRFSERALKEGAIFFLTAAIVRYYRTEPSEGLFSMSKKFGEILRDSRISAGVGLRELARKIGKSPGYLSDVENGNVPPPSEAVILNIAAALGVGKEALLRAASKLDPEVSEYVAHEPRAADFLRMAKDKEFNNGDWDRLTQLAGIAKLGKEEKGER